MTSKIDNAKTTCEGLQLLMRRLNGAAVDLDKGGESAHELLALLATTNTCINNLSSQLNSLDRPMLDNTAPDGNVASISTRKNDDIQPYSPEKLRA